MVTSPQSSRKLRLEAEDQGQAQGERRGRSSRTPEARQDITSRGHRFVPSEGANQYRVSAVQPREQLSGFWTDRRGTYACDLNDICDGSRKLRQNDIGVSSVELSPAIIGRSSSTPCA